IVAQRPLAEVPASFDDQRNDHRSDSVKQRSQLPVSAVANVKRCGDRDENEWRQAECDGHRESTDDSESNVATVNRELIRERSRTGSGKRQSILIPVRPKPAAPLDAV